MKGSEFKEVLQRLGLTQGEAAAKLGIQAGTLRSAISRDVVPADFVAKLEDSRVATPELVEKSVASQKVLQKNVAAVAAKAIKDLPEITPEYVKKFGYVVDDPLPWPKIKAIFEASRKLNGVLADGKDAVLTVKIPSGDGQREWDILSDGYARGFLMDTDLMRKDFRTPAAIRRLIEKKLGPFKSREERDEVCTPVTKAAIKKWKETGVFPE